MSAYLTDALFLNNIIYLRQLLVGVVTLGLLALLLKWLALLLACPCMIQFMDANMNTLSAAGA
eukprot:scaffold46974_cov37-Prasinocladus_malaysianus.AAC.2